MLTTLCAPSMHLVDLITAHAAKNPNKPAVISPGNEITWREFELRTNSIANSLRGRNIRQGDKVAALVGNSAQAVLLFFSALKAGAIYVPVSTYLSPDQMAAVVNDSDAKLFFVSLDHLHLVEPMRGELISLFENGWISIGGAAVPGWDSLESFIAGASDIPTGIPTSLTEIACLWYSSGTTGMPKGIMRSLQSLQALGLSVGIEMGVNSRSVSILSTPLSSSGTWIMLLATVIAGGTLILINKFSASEFLHSVEKYRVTHAQLVPTMLSMLVEEPSLDSADLSSMTAVLSLGSKLHAGTRSAVLQQISRQLYELYGLTEGFATLSLPSEEAVNPGSVGRPLIGNELRIIDDNGNELGPEADGEIVGFSPLMMTGYYKRPDETQKVVWRDERGRTFIRSGDIGRKDKDGFFFISDRKKDMIVSGGLNVYSTDLEAVLNSREEVSDAVVIGVADPKWGEVPVALVRFKHDSNMTVDELKSWANAKLAKHQKIHDVTLWDSFERNALGKYVKYRIRAEYLAQRVVDSTG